MKSHVPGAAADRDSRSGESGKWEHTAVHGFDEGPDPLRELHEFWRQKKAKRQQVPTAKDDPPSSR